MSARFMFMKYAPMPNAHSSRRGLVTKRAQDADVPAHVVDRAAKMPGVRGEAAHRDQRRGAVGGLRRVLLGGALEARGKLHGSPGDRQRDALEDPVLRSLE